ncbi:MAG: D-alanine--D-alanine ligase [Chthoniobacteraceae bacterium]|nr:D-alanine--D-alanine ligase [Chthoniobacteraceae bacterium]
MSSLTHKRIAVLKGGPGSERTISHASAAGVAKALRELGAEVTEIDVTGPDFELPAGIDLVFNIIHGTFGEDGGVQRALEARGVPYTGEGVRGSELAFDKLQSKARFIERGVPTPKFEIVAAGAAPKMQPPYVIKAPCEGSSVGVFIVKTEAEAAQAIADAAKFAKELLVEEFVEGRELTVGILDDQALPIIEIRPRVGFYDWANKYPFLDPTGKGAADHYCPAALDAETTRRVQETALAAKNALDLRIYCRVDLLLPADGKPVVLEINTIPGMTEASLLPEAAKTAGIGYAPLCERIAQLSLARFPAQ